MDKDKDKHILLDIGWADEEKTMYIIHDIDRFKNWLIKKGLDPDEVLTEDNYLAKRIAYLIQRYGDMKVTIGPSNYIGNKGLEVKPAVITSFWNDRFYDELIRRSRFYCTSVTSTVEHIIDDAMPLALFGSPKFYIKQVDENTRMIRAYIPKRFAGWGIYFTKNLQGYYVLDDGFDNNIDNISKAFKWSREDVIKRITEEVNNFKEEEAEKDD